MRAIEIHHTTSTRKTTKRTATELRELRWQLAAVVSFSLGAITFGLGSFISGLAALAILPSQATTAYLTVGSLVASLAFAFLGAHAMDRLDNLNR